MKVAELRDRARVVEVLSKALTDDPGVSSTVKDDGKREQRVRCLMEFAFDNFQSIGGIHISEDGLSAAVSYVPVRQNTPTRDFLLHLKLLLKVIGVFRIRDAMKKKAMIESAHPKDGKFQNVWMMGTLSDQKDQEIKKIKDYLLQLATSENLPLYVETGDEAERDEYEQMGLEVHKTVELAPKIFLWFMRTKG